MTPPLTGPPLTGPSRNDIETTASCPVCRSSFTPVRRQRYCTPACRQAAWRARTNTTTLTAGITAARASSSARGTRREHTVYSCTECDQRYLAQQWCEDCARPCIRIGYGGLCTNCDEPLAIDELLNTHQDHLTAESRENEAFIKPGAVNSESLPKQSTLNDRRYWSHALDVKTGSGTVYSDLPIENCRTGTGAGSITVRARTGRGDVRLVRVVA